MSQEGGASSAGSGVGGEQVGSGGTFAAAGASATGGASSDPAAQGELGTTCVPLGEPAALSGPFVDGATLWSRVAPFVFGEVTATPAVLAGDYSYEAVGELVRQSFAQAQAERSGAPGARMFVGEWLRRETEDALQLTGDWAALLADDAPALPILLQSRLPGTGRIGAFTEPDWLTRHTTISGRGAAISTSLFQAGPPAPPPGTDKGTPDSGLPDREALAEHVTNPSCAACHSLLDPLAFPLGSFDAAGDYRELDHGLPLDLSGTYRRESMDIQYDGLMDFGVKVADTCLANQAFAQSLLRLALNMREASPQQLEEQLSANQGRIAQAFIRSGRSYPDLVVAYAQSPLALRP